MPAVSSIRITPGTGAISFSPTVPTPFIPLKVVIPTVPAYYIPPKVVNPTIPAYYIPPKVVSPTIPAYYIPPKVVSPTIPAYYIPPKVGSPTVPQPIAVAPKPAPVVPISSNTTTINTTTLGTTGPQFLSAAHFTQTIANGSTISFDNSHSQFILDKPQILQATVMNFGFGDSIQLLGFHAGSTFAFANNRMTMTDAKTHLTDSFTLTNGIAVGGTYSAANFSVRDTSFGQVISFVAH